MEGRESCCCFCESKVILVILFGGRGNVGRGEVVVGGEEIWGVSICGHQGQRRVMRKVFRALFQQNNKC